MNQLQDLTARRGRLDGLIDLYTVRHGAKNTEAYRQVMAALRLQRDNVVREIEKAKAA